MNNKLKKLYFYSYYVAVSLFVICINMEFNNLLHTMPHFVFFTLKSIIAILLLFKLFIDLIYFKKDKIKFILILFILIYLFFTIYVTKLLSFLNIILLLMCFKNINLKKVLKIILYLNLIFMLFNIIYTLFIFFNFNTIPILDDASGRRTRYLINYIHPNSVGAFFSSIVLITYYLFYLNMNKCKKKLIVYDIVTILFSLLIFYLTDSRTMILVIFTFLFLFNLVFFYKKSNILNFSSKYLFIFITSFMILFLYFNKNIDYSYYVFFDKLLSGRLSYAIHFSNITGIHFFPFYTSLIENNQLVVDSFYSIYLITYGFLWLIIFYAVMLKSIKKLYSIEKVYLIIFSLIGIVEKWNINIALCCAPLIIVNALFNRKVKKNSRNKTNIAYIFTALSHGGVEQSFYTYLSNMNMNKYNIVIITQGLVVDSIRCKFEKLGIRVFKIPSKKENIFKHYIVLSSILKDGNFDIFHCNMSSKSFYYLVVAKIYNIKLRIAHSHGFELRTNSMVHNFKYDVYNYLTCLFSNYYLASSKEAGDFVFGDRKYLILPNGIDCDNFLFNNTIRIDVRCKLGLKNSDILLGHIGRFENIKNHEFMIRIAKRLVKKNQNYKFLFIGKGELKNSIVKLCNEYKLNNNVIFIDYTEEPQNYYYAMDMFLFPSLHEGFGICVVEANCSGLPCICSENVPFETNVVNLNSYLSLIEDEWIDKIMNIKFNDDIMRVQANNKVKKTIYNINNCVNMLEKLYEL